MREALPPSLAWPAGVFLAIPARGPRPRALVGVAFFRVASEAMFVRGRTDPRGACDDSSCFPDRATTRAPWLFHSRTHRPLRHGARNDARCRRANTRRAAAR